MQPNTPETLIFNVPNDSELVFLEHVVIYMTLSVTGYSEGYGYGDLNELQHNGKDFDSDFEYEDFNLKENGQYYEFLTASHPRRGDIQVTLTSPRGTLSILLPYRDRDFINRVGYQEWPFMSVHFWGEKPVGNWTAKVYYRSSSGSVQLTVHNMTLYGTREAPQAVYESSKCSHFRHISTLECVNSCESDTTEYEKYCIEGTVVQTTNSKRNYSCGSTSSGSNKPLIVGLSVSFSLLFIGSILVCLILKVYCYCNRRKRARAVYNIVHADNDEDFDE